jgi:hydroxymethylpyrimidine pyrophosphatase-like HAD family hydrolase
VLAFGDGSNDVPMMEWAGFSVAMGSATEAVRRIASWVAPPFEDDGFAEAVEGILSGRIGCPKVVEAKVSGAGGSDS